MDRRSNPKSTAFLDGSDDDDSYHDCEDDDDSDEVEVPAGAVPAIGSPDMPANELVEARAFKAQKQKRDRDRKRLNQNGNLKWIEAEARNAVFDCAPPTYGQRVRRQHLYWAKTPKYHCAFNLILRTQRLQEFAVQYKSKLNLANLIAKLVVSASRGARNKHIYQLKKLFFSHASPHKIAEHVLEGETTNADGEIQEMKLAPKFTLHMDSITEMKALLKSSDLHADPVVYPHFVSAFQAGKMTNMPKQPKTVALADMLSVTYEAHFRCELWYCLNKQGLTAAFDLLFSCLFISCCL